jgi:phosphoglycerol transferase MdoB-like AlkP superfamily enzyme
MNHNNIHSPALIARLQTAASLAFVWLLAILVLSSAEWIANFHHIASGQYKITLLLLKLPEDTIFWLKTYPVILAVYLGSSFLSFRLAAALSIALLLLLVLVQAMLAIYFSRAFLPLGADLYGYSLKEIIQTSGASGGVPIGMALILLAFLTALGLVFRIVIRRNRVPTWLALLLPLLSLLAWTTPDAGWRIRKNFATDFDANLVSNKLNYFVSRSWGHFFFSPPETDIYSDSYAAEEQSASTGLPFIYPDQPAFPFYHTDNYQDVLSPFFTLPDSPIHNLQPPSIVIILVEGLGRAFTNDGAYLGNFTPFVDSLAHHSLYWKNFLSEGGRTFAVLPSLLGSLPFGKNGFLAMAEAMPRQLSLIDILRANGYHSSFYYGGDAHFDNMDIFLHNGGVEEINDERSFPAGSARLPAINGFSWGYDDRAVFRHQQETRPDNGPSTRSPRIPQLSIILTVSTHSPFAINEQAKYAAVFEQRMTLLGMNQEEKTAHRAFKDQFASILYADDALRGFFSAYSKRADYANTIFIITGDHRMPEIPMRTKIDRYHVPLIVFSPLLKRTAEFQSVSTHFDLTPSLLAFLAARYGLQRPPDVAWIGSGLDTARQFRNIHAYPLMQTKTDLLDFIDGEFHLNGSTLFHLSPDLNESPVTDDLRKQTLEDAFNRFLRLNDRVVPGSKLVPDSSLLFFRK